MDWKSRLSNARSNIPLTTDVLLTNPSRGMFSRARAQPALSFEPRRSIDPMKSYFVRIALIAAVVGCTQAKPAEPPKPDTSKDSAAQTGLGGMSQPNADPF